MKKLALIALLGIAGIANALYVGVDGVGAGIDAGPVRRDIIAEDPENVGLMADDQRVVVGNNAVEPGVTPADQGYYYTPYGNRPVANTVAGVSSAAADAVESTGSAAAAVIPF